MAGERWSSEGRGGTIGREGLVWEKMGEGGAPGRTWPSEVRRRRGQVSGAGPGEGTRIVAAVLGCRTCRFDGLGYRGPGSDGKRG